MRQRHYTLTSAQVRHEAEALVQQHLPLADYKKSITAGQLRQLLLVMACWGLSLFAACRRLKGYPSHETCRKALHANLPELDQLRKLLVEALQSNLPRCLRRRRRWDLALDLHCIPFYGDKQTKGIRGGQHKQGTKYFWTYATICVVHKGHRWTLGLLPVCAKGLELIVTALLEQVKQSGIRIRTLLLDRGFYSAEVIACLQDKQIPFVMPALKRGRLNGGNGPTGTAGYFAKTEDGLFEHTWNKGGKKSGMEVTVNLAVVVHSRRLRPKEKQKGKKAGKGGWLKETWVFAYGGLTVNKARALEQRYSRRFGIESSYRQLRQALARTSSKDERVRLLLVGLALLLRNVWVWLHWQVLSTPRRGGRRFRLDRLRLETMLFWIAEEIKALYGVRLEVQIDR